MWSRTVNTRRVLRDRDLLVLIGTRLTPRTSPVKGCSCPSLLTRKPPYAGRYSVGGERMVQNGRHPVFSTAYWISYEVRSVVWLLAHLPWLSIHHEPSTWHNRREELRRRLGRL